VETTTRMDFSGITITLRAYGSLISRLLRGFDQLRGGKKGKISEKDKKRTNIQEKIKKKRE
jgi:hypothetical protein